MEKEQLIAQIENLVHVTYQQVIFAKNYFLTEFNTDALNRADRHIKTHTMINKLLEASDARMPDYISNVDFEQKLKAVVKSIEWTIAGCEAIWSLFSANLLFPAKNGEKLIVPINNLGYSFHMSGHIIEWKNLSIAIWEKIQFSRSISTEMQILSDPDLFLHTLNILNIHHDVEEALREAVRCFRHELYLASLTMLGRAVEGSWIEMGLKLANINSAGKSLEKILLDQFVGIGKKINKICDFYGNTDKTFRENVNVNINDLIFVSTWSDVVRDSRNSIHYGAISSIPNNYEKIASLLIGAVPYLRLLYKIYNGITIP